MANCTRCDVAMDPAQALISADGMICQNCHDKQTIEQGERAAEIALKQQSHWSEARAQDTFNSGKRKVSAVLAGVVILLLVVYVIIAAIK